MSFPSRESRFLDCANARYSRPLYNQSLYPVGAAGETPVLALAQDDKQRCGRRGEATQDPYAYYRAFLNSAVPSDSGHTGNFIPSHKYSDTREDMTPMLDQGLDGNRPLHARCRTTPYSLAVRLANRSEGTPLATIIEQVSVSTLNSHGSLLGATRFPSIRTVENTSPVRVRAADQSFRESASLGVGEAARQKIQIGSSTERKSERRRSRSDPLHKAGLSAQLDLSQLPESEGHDLEYTSLRCYLRGALKDVLGSSRSPSNNSPSTTKDLETCSPTERGPKPGQFTPGIGQRSYEVQNYFGNQNTEPAPSTAERSDVNTPQCSPVENHATSRTFVGMVEPSAGVCALNLQIQPLTDQKTSNVSLPSPLPSVPEYSRHRKVETAATTVRPVLLNPRDITPEHVLTGASTLPQRVMDGCSRLEVQKHQKCTNEDVPFYRLETPLRLDFDQASSAKPNCSFCSTLSTSYSGSVLGVDLDLLGSCDHCIERGSTTPVWFTPIEKNFETNSQREKSYPRDRTGSAGKEVQTDPSPSRSIHSPALSALLPIAAAEGIIQPNKKNPQLSFFLPTGSLIHTESPIYSKSEKPLRLPQYVPNLPPPRDSHRPRTARSTPIYEGNQPTHVYDVLSAAIGLPPNRPTFLPMTTPPKLVAPLPYSLRHHHHEQSRIVAEEDEECVSLFNILQSEPKTRGCCGMLKTGASKLQKNTPSPMESCDESILCVKIRKTIRSGFKILNSSSPSPSGRGRTLKKRNRNPLDAPCFDPSPNEEGYVPGDMGKVVGHIMRLLFCQPFDGAGMKIDVGDRCGGFGPCKKQIGAEWVRGARDSATPNVRIVDSDNGTEETVSEAATEVIDSKERRMARETSDSGVSTDVAVRVAVMGA